MKVEDFKQALELVKPGLASKELMEQSTSVILDGDHIWTFNDEVGVKAPFDIGMKGAVIADPVYQFLSKLDKGSEIIISEKDGKFVISSGRFRASISIDFEIKLPIDEISEPKKWEKLPEGFLPAIDKVLFSVGASGHLPMLTCIHITSEFIESCDVFRLTRCFGEMLKLKGVKELNIVGRHLDNLLDYSPTEIGVTDKWVHFRNKEKVVYSVRSIEGEYPDLDRHLEVEGPDIQFPEDIYKDLDWASVALDNKKINKFEHGVTVGFSKRGLSITGKSDCVAADSLVRMKYSGEAVEFGAHPLFLKEIIKLAKKITAGPDSLKVEGDNFVHIVSLTKKKE